MIAMAMAQQVDLLAIVIKPIQAQYIYIWTVIAYKSASAGLPISSFSVNNITETS